MTFTSDKTHAIGRDDEILARAQRRLQRAFERLGTWRAVAAERGVNHGYVSMVMSGRVPGNRQVRAALGLPRVMPSERRTRSKRMIPLLGSDGWQKVFFKKLIPRKRWRKL